MAGVGAEVVAESTAEAIAGRGGQDHAVESETRMTFSWSEQQHVAWRFEIFTQNGNLSMQIAARLKALGA